MVRIPDNFQSRLPSVGAPTGPGRIDISTRAQRSLAQAGQQIQQLGDRLFQQGVQEQASKLELQGQQELERLQNDAIQQPDFRQAPESFREQAKSTVSNLVNQANPVVQDEVRSRLARQAATMTNQLRERSIGLSQDATQAAISNQLQSLSRQYAQTDRPNARKEIERQMNETAKRLRSAGLTMPEVRQTQNETLATADAARVQQLLNQNNVQGASEFLNQSDRISIDQTRVLKNRIDAKQREVNKGLRSALKVAEDHFLSTGQLPKVNVGGFETLEEFEQAAEGTEVGQALRGLRNNASFVRNHASKPIADQQRQLQNLQAQAQRDPRVRRRMELAQRATRRQIEAVQSDDPYGAAAELGLVSEQPDLPFDSVLQGGQDAALVKALTQRVEAQQALTEHITGQPADDVQIGGQVDLLKDREREQLSAILDSQPADAAASILQKMSKALGPDNTRKLAGSLAKKSNLVGFAAQVANEQPAISRKMLRSRAGSEAEVKVPQEADREFTNSVGRSLSIQDRQKIRPVADGIYKTMVIDQGLDPSEFHADVYQDAAKLATGGVLDSAGNVQGGPADVGGRMTLPPRRGMTPNQTRNAFEALSQERNFQTIFQQHANGLPARMNPQTGEIEQLNPEDLEDIQPRLVEDGKYTIRLNQDGKPIHAVDPNTGQHQGALKVNLRRAIENGDLQTGPLSHEVRVDIPVLGEVDLPIGSTGVEDEFGTEPNQPEPVGRFGPGTGGQGRTTITPQNTGPPIAQSVTGGIFRKAFRSAVEFFTEDEGGDPGKVTVQVPSRPPRGVGQPIDRAAPKGDDNSRPPIPRTKTQEIMRAIQGQAADIQVDQDGGVQVPQDVLQSVDVQGDEDLPRGIRNNNPMNIKDFDIPWKGAVDESTDETFEQFESPAFGIRAGVRDILNDHIKDGKRTIRGLFGEFAPESENPTTDYVNFVADRLQVAPSAQVDLTKPGVLQDLVKATIEFENGIQPYSDRMIASGVAMALESQPGIDE